MKSAHEMVEEFHLACDQPIRERPTADIPEEERRLRIELIREEFERELVPAIESGDIVEIADALGDLKYVIEGAALAFGVPLAACFAEIHRSNMTKLGDDGRAIKRADGKVLKGPNYERPNIAAILGRRPAPPPPVDTIVVGVVAPAGAGKSSVGEFLEAEYGARRYAFADPLKDLVRDVFELEEHQVRGTQAQKETVDPRYGVTPRWIMQRVGTDGLGDEFWDALPANIRRAALERGRVILETCDSIFVEECFVCGFREIAGENVWIDPLIKRIRIERPALAVIDDMRFPNEAQAVLALQPIGEGAGRTFRVRGEVWRVHPVGASSSTDDGTHASETGWRTAPASAEIRPSVRGLGLLFALVRQTAARCYIRPATAL